MATATKAAGAPLKLDIKTPVPSDIEIAQAAIPLPITEIAEKLNIPAEYLEQYGPTKAKVGHCGFIP